VLNIVDFVNSLKFEKITDNNKTIFQKYLHAYFKVHEFSTSRFSKMYINAQKEYYFAIYDDMLLYFRLSAYTRKKGGSLTLYCAPITLNNDVNKEKEIINYLLKNGISVVISEEDKNRYGYQKEDLKYLSTYDDFILSSKLLFDLEGRDFKHFRWRLNRYQKQLNDGILFENYTFESNDNILESIDITKKWIVEWKEKGNRVWEDPIAYSSKYPQYSKLNDEYLYGYIRSANEQIVFEITEKMTQTQIISTAGYKNYDDDILKEANEIILLRGVRKWYEILGNHFYLNLSYCGFLGNLRKQKMKYKPIKILKHYKLFSDEKAQRYIIDNFDKFIFLNSLKIKAVKPRAKSSWRNK